MPRYKVILEYDGSAFVGTKVGDYLVEGEGKRIVDLHFVLRGPIVQQMEAVFVSDWRFATGESDGLELLVPTLHGTAACRSVVEGPDHELDRLTALYTGACAAARDRIAARSSATNRLRSVYISAPRSSAWWTTRRWLAPP